MLIPRFTTRWLLSLTTVCGVFFAILACAVRGQIWAAGISLAVAFAAVAFVVYGAFFGGAYVLAALLGLALPKQTAGVPFATAAPPPQILPPEEPDSL